MVRSSCVLLAAAALSLQAGLGQALFSVHDDILAFPQFQVTISQDSYITEADAREILSNPPSPPTASATTPDSSSTSSSDPSSSDTPPQLPATYEQLWWENRRYLCSVPVVATPPPLNATEKEIARQKEEKELARASTRGWELLADMDGKCLYFVSGWWSYSFCHNREIRQFHPLPAANGAPTFPPKEDPESMSYVLGRAQTGVGKRGRGEQTELSGTGELRYLVQKLGGGTVCDITGKERRIEVQYHCNPSSTDRIGFVKEVSICCYLMVVYTPRLCKDVAFLPPREGRANTVECKEILKPTEIPDWINRKAKEAELQKLKEMQEAHALEQKKKLAIEAGARAKKAKGKGAVGGKDKTKHIKLKTNDEEIVLIVPEDFVMGAGLLGEDGEILEGENVQEIEVLPAHDEL